MSTRHIHRRKSRYVVANVTQRTVHKTSKRWTYFFQCPVSRKSSFCQRPLISLFKNMSQPDRGVPDGGPRVSVEVDIGFLIWQEMFMSRAWGIWCEGGQYLVLPLGKKGATSLSIWYKESPSIRNPDRWETRDPLPLWPPPRGRHSLPWPFPLPGGVFFLPAPSRPHVFRP